MTRKKLASEAYKIIWADLGNEKSEKEIWKAIAETDDYSLIEYIKKEKKI